MFKRAIIFMVFVAILPLSVMAQETPAPEPVQTEIVEQVRVNHDGVQFMFDAALADAVSVINHAATEGDVMISLPAYTQFVFDGYGEGDYLAFAPQPHLDVLAIEDFGDYPELVQGLDELNRILAERPDLSQYVVADTGGQELELPMLPPVRATQVFRAQPAYIEVDGVRGIRYLAYYSQAVDPIIEGSVFYTFQGITDDGQHYVSLVLPVNTGVLPTEIEPIEDYDAFAETYQQYLTETLQSIATLPSSSFTPSLGQLDAIAQSIDVER